MFLKLIRQALFTVQLGLEMQLQKLISAPSCSLHLMLASPSSLPLLYHIATHCIVHR